MNIGQDILIKCLDCGFTASEAELLNGKFPNCNSENIEDVE